MKEIKNYIKEYIQTKVEEKYHKKCKECKNDFKLTFGEIKFFKDKNLSLPNRCKCCRDTRKQNN